MKFINCCFIIPSLFLFVVSCNSPVPEQKATTPNKDSATQIPETKKTSYADGLLMWTNVEQIQFCVPVPSGEFLLDTINEYERAKFVFKSKVNEKHQIILQGLNRSDTKVSLEEYFKNAYPAEDEENGKKVEIKEIIKPINCFYAKGYFSNAYYDTRFLEVTWLRADDVVSLKVFYDVKDTTLWERRLKQILECDSNCK